MRANKEITDMACVSPVKASFASAHGRSLGAAIAKCGAQNLTSENNSSPVDLVHLSKQSLGDRSLENEILRLFQSQSALYLDRLANATTSQERRFAAHTLVGSARGLGAWKVASEAQKIEVHCAKDHDISMLRQAIDEANDYISALLAG